MSHNAVDERRYELAADAPPPPPVAPDAGGSDGPGMPFGIRLEHDANVTIVRRPDGPPGARGVDPFGV
jgi:hypothetical protein